MEKPEQHIEEASFGCLETGMCFFLVFAILYYPIHQINTAKLEAGTPPGETLDSSFEFLMNIETLFHTFMASGIVMMIIALLVAKWSEKS